MAVSAIIRDETNDSQGGGLSYIHHGRKSLMSRYGRLPLPAIKQTAADDHQLTMDALSTMMGGLSIKATLLPL